MKHRNALIFAPILAALAVAAGGAFTGSASAHTWFQAVTALIVKTAALAGCYWAARGFERGDYLRRAWLLVAFGYLPLVIKDVLPGGGPWMPTAGPAWGYTRALMALAGNAVSVAGAWMLARASHIAGLEPPGSPAMRRFVAMAVTVLAIAFVAPGLLSDLRDARHGDTTAMIAVAGDFGDVLSFLLITPVLLTAVAMRGGRLVWPWALLTAGNVGWLFFDAPTAIGLLTGGMTATLKDVAEVARVAACLYYAGAGLAQRWALSDHESGE